MVEAQRYQPKVYTGRDALGTLRHPLFLGFELALPLSSGLLLPTQAHSPSLSPADS